MFLVQPPRLGGRAHDGVVADDDERRRVDLAQAGRGTHPSRKAACALFASMLNTIFVSTRSARAAS
jgi:hypothetical protein